MPKSTVALVLICAAAAVTGQRALAEDVPWPPEPEKADVPTVETVIAQPLPARFCLADDDREHATRAFDAALAARLEAAAGVPAPFTAPVQTDGLIERLIAARRLPLLTLMKTDSTDVFFGVNESGRLGVHVDASLLMAQR